MVFARHPREASNAEEVTARLSGDGPEVFAAYRGSAKPVKGTWSPRAACVDTRRCVPIWKMDQTRNGEKRRATVVRAAPANGLREPRKRGLAVPACRTESHGTLPLLISIQRHIRTAPPKRPVETAPETMQHVLTSNQARLYVRFRQTQ